MFSEQEFRGRIKKVSAGMSDLRLDALVVIGDERPIGGGNVRYLTNYYNPLPLIPAAVVITPLDVTLCVSPGFFGSSFWVARQQSPWLNNVVGTRVGFWGVDLAKDIKDAMDKAELIGRRIGLDGLGLMPETLAKSIRASLRDAELVENTCIVERARLVKSPFEFEAIREAARLTDISTASACGLCQDW